MGISIQGLSGSMDVDSAGNARVVLPNDLTKSGYASVVAESDDGEIIGSATRRQLEASQDFRLRIGQDNIFWDDTFNHGVQNTSTYQGVTSGMTISITSGFLNLNGASAVSSGNVCRLQTYKSFPTFGTFPLYFEAWIGFTAALQANSIHEFGLGYATGVTTPTDGVFFRVSGTSILGVTNNNSSEQTVILDFEPGINDIAHYLIIVHGDRVEFWINDLLYGFINTPSGLTGPSLSPSLPLLLRQYNTGVVGASISTKVGRITISQGDLNNNRLWPTQMVGQGQGGYLAPPGATAGQTANSTNNAAPTIAVLSNTAASYTTLGGQFAITGGHLSPAETDYALFAYQVPVGSSAVPGKSLNIRGIRIDTFLSGSQTLGPISGSQALQWAVGLGSTAASLATTDSSTGGTRAPRRITLGVQTFPTGSQVGSFATPLDFNFDVPLTVEQGTFFHLILKIPVGTVTSGALAIRGTSFINSYFE